MAYGGFDGGANLFSLDHTLLEFYHGVLHFFDQCLSFVEIKDRIRAGEDDVENRFLDRGHEQ
jgi:hypothetical protein